jgi:hypothetical protein
MSARSLGPSTLTGGRRRRQAGATVLVLAALAVGHAVTSSYSSDSAIVAPFLRSGTVGQPVSLRYATITVLSVHGSSEVSQAGTVLTTPGVFVVARVRIVARGDLRTLLYSAVRTRDGATYVESAGGRSSFDFGPAQPGLPRYGTVTVELPTSQAAGARLRIALDPIDQSRDDMTDIDLGVTPADAAQFAADKTPVPVPPSSATVNGDEP